MPVPVIWISLDVDVDFSELKVKLHITIQCVTGWAQNGAYMR